MEKFTVLSWIILDSSNTLLFYISTFLLLPSIKNKRNIIISFIFTFLFTYIDLYFATASMFLIFLTYWLLFIKTDSKINLSVKFIVLMSSLFVITLTQSIASYFVIKVFKFSFYSHSNRTLFATFLLVLMNYLISIMVILFIKYFLKSNIIAKKFHNKMLIGITLLSITIITISYISLVLITKHNFNQLTYLEATLAITLVSALFIIIGSIMLIIGYTKELKSNYENRHLKERNLYINELERNNTELRRFKHDYKNLLSSLSVSINSNNQDNDSIQRLLDYADSNINMTSTVKSANLYHITDSLVKGIIVTKLVAAKNKNIDLNFEIDQNVVITKSLSVEITRILGILFDNAIEASVLTERPKIKFAIVTFDDYLEFVLKNTINSNKKINLNQISKTGYTSKKGHNGLGLSTVNKIIHSNNNLLFQTKIEKDYFSTILTVLKDK